MNNFKEHLHYKIHVCSTYKQTSVCMPNVLLVPQPGHLEGSRVGIKSEIEQYWETRKLHARVRAWRHEPDPFEGLIFVRLTWTLQNQTSTFQTAISISK